MSNVLKKAKQLTVLKESVEKAKSLIVRKEKIESPKSLPAHTEMPDTYYKSKLMICIEILCTLVSNGPMKLPQLIDKFEMDEARLKPHLRLLWDRGLIEEEKFDNITHYVVTERGLTVLKVVSPLIREAHKFQMRNFEVLSSVLSGAGYV
jgi:predicted transcriptional regulator